MAFSALRTCAAAALLATLNACTFWSGDFERLSDQSERDFHHDPSMAYKGVELDQILAAPSSYKYIDVRFEAILNRVGEAAFAPMWTTFVAEDYLSFSAWPGDAELWRSDVRSRSHPLFFVRKDNKALIPLIGAGQFSRVRVSGRVMGDFEQKAWIYVNNIEVLEKEIFTDDGLAALSLAAEARAAKQTPEAIRHYEIALDGVWVTDLRLWVHLELAWLYEGQGSLDQALAHYEGALQNDPQNSTALEGKDRVSEAIEAKAAAEAAAAAAAPRP